MHISTIVICVVVSACVLAILAKLFSNWLFKPLSLTAEKTGDRKLDRAQNQVETLDLELGIAEDLGGINPGTLNHVQAELATAQMTRDLAKSTYERRKAIQETKQEKPVEDAVIVRNPQRTTG